MLTFIDFFAGIGGFRLGLEKAGMKCVGYCEKDTFALKSYRAMHNTKGEWYGDDITKLKAEDIPKADIWTAGSPCQNVSITGKRSGLHGERSGLFFKFIELLQSKKEEDRPEWVILENVKGLLSSGGGTTSSNISLKWTNVGMTHSGRCSTLKITESPKTGKGYILSDILEDTADEKYYLSPEQTERLLTKL